MTATSWQSLLVVANSRIDAHAGKAQHLGLNAIANGKRAEFVNPRGQFPDLRYEVLHQSFGDLGFRLQQLSERDRWNRCDEAARARFDGRGARHRYEV